MTQDQRSEALRQLVQEVLPEVWEDLDYLLQSDTQFQELSQQYEDCLASLRRWQATEESPQPKAEDASLLEKLEQEIFHYLNCHREPRTPDRGEYDDDRR